MLSPFRTETALRILQGLSILLVGMLVGAGLMVLQVGPRLERLSIERGQLLSQLQWYRTRVSKLGEQLSAQRWIVVEEVKLVIEGLDSESVVHLELRKELLPYLQQLLGRPVVHLDAEVVASIFEGRVWEYAQKRYRISVKRLVLARIARLTLEVRTENVMRPDQSE